MVEINDYLLKSLFHADNVSSEMFHGMVYGAITALLATGEMDFNTAFNKIVESMPATMPRRYIPSSITTSAWVGGGTIASNETMEYFASHMGLTNFLGAVRYVLENQTSMLRDDMDEGHGTEDDERLVESLESIMYRIDDAV